MNELALKYGCNPNQKPSRIYMEDGSDLPVAVLNGKPGYINFLDALNSIQLVKELKRCVCRNGFPARSQTAGVPVQTIAESGAEHGLLPGIFFRKIGAERFGKAHIRLFRLL